MIESETDVGLVTSLIVGLLTTILFCCLCCCYYKNRAAEARTTDAGTLVDNALHSPQTLINGVSVKNGGTRNAATRITFFSSASVPRATAIPEAIPVFGSTENCRYYDVVDSEKGLLQAVVRSDLDAFNLLLARTGKSASELTFWRGTTLMHVAVLAKQSPTTMILALINDHHMSVDVRNENGTTPLMLAVMMNNLVVAKFLIRECSADVSCRDANGLNVFERNECHPETMTQLKSFVGHMNLQIDPAAPVYVPVNPRSRSTLPPPGCRLGCRQSPQRSGALMTFLLYTWSILMLACYAPTVGQVSVYDLAGQLGGFINFCFAAGPSPWNDWGSLILGLIYGLYLLEGLFWNRTVDYLRAIRSAEWSFAKLAAEAGEKPVLVMLLECYHTDSEGNKMVTHSAALAWEFDEYLDKVSDLPYHDGLAKIKIRHEWGFANKSTRDEFERAKENFVRENKRDVQQDFSTKLVYENKCVSHLSLDQSRGAKALSLNFYRVCTVFLCSLWYRLAINSTTPKVELVSTKLLLRRRVELESASSSREEIPVAKEANVEGEGEDEEAHLKRQEQ